MKLIAYTDASYRERLDVAACGFVTYKDNRVIKNSVILVGGLKKIINAEIFAIKEALQYCFLQWEVTSIEIYTDQKAIAKRIREGLGRKQFFRELYEIIQIIDEHGIELIFHYVKSHGKNKLHNKVDNNCSRALRNYLKSQPALAEKEFHHSKRKKAA